MKFKDWNRGHQASNRSHRVINPFERLPTEIIQYIAYLLPSDADIAHFSSCCRTLAERILPGQSAIWRARFQDRYDPPRNRNSFEIKVEYQIREIVLAQKISFKHGEKDEQNLWLTVIQDMLLESSRLCGEKDMSASKSFTRIRQVVFDSGFLSIPVNGYEQRKHERPSDLFCGVQLCLTGLALDPEMSVSCLRTGYDIGTVYSYQPGDNQTPNLSPPLSIDPGVRKITQIRNFWLRHLLNPNEASFYTSYMKLLPHLRPKPSTNLTRHYTAPAENWLGYYSCIHPYPETLDAPEMRQTCGDLSAHLTQVDCMSLTLHANRDPLNWPPAFQALIPFLADERSRVYFRGVQTNHNSDDGEMYLVRGFVEPLQDVYGGFPGWKRICFAIYAANRDFLPILEGGSGQGQHGTGMFPNEAWPPIDMEVEFTCIHGYEGRLLPGGSMILGQWVDMRNTTGKGPFIFWDV
ncbi:hypothetical protein FE257_004849 [Aspergillus nanangensis]|uniref:F-box domain-containing protein n=1 Tax=Aspergillus nanangensis TaxID=2582783 RepID=A0AAD4CRD0_ASPNN|nr:hypothetical protein FE257_004849 [Aspergillus nanangensis]